MRHTRRFCVSCNKDQLLVIREKEKFSMYHCRVCGEEICRLGDGAPDHTEKVIKNLTNSMSYIDLEDSSPNVLLAALKNPDILSDEQAMWQQRDLEAEEQRASLLAVFRGLFAQLTPRQQEVVEAVAKCGSQEAAAITLGTTRTNVAQTINKIKKKLKVLEGNISDKDEHNMEGMYDR